MTDSWNPEQYAKFSAERSRPFFDLLSLVQFRPSMRVADLGCGTGQLTAELHRHLHARETLGIDSSPAMLERTKEHEAAGLRFVQKRIEDFASLEPFDLLFSNAAFHWVEDHPRLLSRLTAMLARGGQLAVQLPANYDHASHRAAADVAAEPEFAGKLAGWKLRENVLAPEAYAVLLDGLDYGEQTVRLQVYGHKLASSGDVVEWTKGTLLTAYQERLGPELFETFVERYRKRLLAEIGDRRPYFFTFKRILIWARRR